MATDLEADCSRCAALCCVTLAFDRSEAFPFDKAAGERCRHLDDDCRCAIHSQLAGRGFQGCVQFDCLGAGQRVTAMFIEGSWADRETLSPGVIETFRQMRKVHELIALLKEAARLPLDSEHEARCHSLLNALEPDSGWSQEALERFEAGSLPDEVQDFLGQLRGTARRHLASSRPK